MKYSIVYLILFLLFFYSCQENRQDQTQLSTPGGFFSISSDQIDSLLENLPDSMRKSDNKDSNYFQLALPEEVDAKMSSEITGTWYLKSSSLSFHYSDLQIGDSLFLADEPRIVASGWGTLSYKRYLKADSHIYEYYVSNDGYLNIVWFNYRNENNTVIETVEPQYEKLRIIAYDGKSCLLDQNGYRVELSR